MATSAVVRLQQRAAQADQLIAHLRSQLDILRKNATVTSCRSEEQKLESDNAALKEEVHQLRQKLVQLEISNGVKQVSLPAPGSRPRSAASAPAPAAAVSLSAEAKPASTNNISVQQKVKKEKKEGVGKKQKAEAVPEGPVDVSCLDMRIGFINSAMKHPDADTLYVEEVDVGEEKPRTVVSGLVKHIPLEQMQRRYAIFMCNLKPAKMRGILSEGMIMCASSPEKVEIIEPPGNVIQGEKVTVEGYTGTPPAQLPPKKKMWEQVQPDLWINEEGLATYKGAKWVVGDKGTCKAPTMRKSGIK